MESFKQNVHGKIMADVSVGIIPFPIVLSVIKVIKQMKSIEMGNRNNCLYFVCRNISPKCRTANK